MSLIRSYFMDSLCCPIFSQNLENLNHIDYLFHFRYPIQIYLSDTLFHLEFWCWLSKVKQDWRDSVMNAAFRWLLEVKSNSLAELPGHQLFCHHLVWLEQLYLTLGVVGQELRNLDLCSKLHFICLFPDRALFVILEYLWFSWGILPKKIKFGFVIRKVLFWRDSESWNH